MQRKTAIVYIGLRTSTSPLIGREVVNRLHGARSFVRPSVCSYTHLRRPFTARSHTHTHTHTRRRVQYVIRLMSQPAHPSNSRSTSAAVAVAAVHGIDKFSSAVRPTILIIVWRTGPCRLRFAPVNLLSVGKTAVVLS